MDENQNQDTSVQPNMDESEQTSKPKIGTYDEMPTDIERRPKVDFSIIGATKEVTFKDDFVRPVELGNDKEGVYYLFHCVEDNEDKVIMTSAWSLLKGFKTNEPLAGKILSITKEMTQGKQNYKVELKLDPNAVETQKIN